MKRTRSNDVVDEEEDGESFLKDQTIAVSQRLKLDAKLGGDRDGLAEKLSDAGALVTHNVNKGLSFVVSDGTEADDELISKAKRLCIPVVNSLYVREIFNKKKLLPFPSTSSTSSTSASTSTSSSSASSFRAALDGLPDRVLHHIFSYLTIGDLPNVLFTCKKLSKAVDHPSVWRSVFINSGYAQREPVEITENWRDTIAANVNSLFVYYCGHVISLGDVKPKKDTKKKKKKDDEDEDEEEEEDGEGDEDGGDEDGEEEEEDEDEDEDVDYTERKPPKQCPICYSEFSNQFDYKTLLREKWWSDQIGETMKHNDKKICLAVPGATDYMLDPLFISMYPVHYSETTPIKSIQKLKKHNDIVTMLLEAGFKKRNWKTKSIDKFMKYQVELLDEYEDIRPHLRECLAELKKHLKKEEIVEGMEWKNTDAKFYHYTDDGSGDGEMYFILNLTKAGNYVGVWQLLYF
eukprot:TRINITY_DN1181_c0_g6_i1.p1 TRINITY_DN1181_c0_g6~~TRINITY_DN1181_c0_g6_i1.p1  ORF type:complete len:462 (-),score=153.92 TRINITY_DN1181_c0_g6_i1:234-1619(-)